MAIKDPLMFITIEEFKNWKGFNKSLFDEVTTPDSEIRYAIEIASSNIDYLSGFTISKKWPEINPTKFTDNIQTATTHYVNFLLGKGVEYARGQASIGQGGITYSQNNPEDPYYIVPQVFNYLKEINEYPIMQGFNLNVSPKQNWFKKFMGNGGEQNPWEIYLQSNNIKSSDNRTKITISHPKNIMGSVVYIDTNGIKSFDNLTTIELFTKYFSNDTMKLVDGKEGQEKKVISATGGSGESLWEVDKDNPNFIKPKDDKGIDVNGKRIIDVGTPTFLSDATTKEYVDNLLDKKQSQLTENNAGDNITITGTGSDIKINSNGGSSVDENRIFNNKDDKDSTTRLVNEVIKTNVGGKTLIYRNNPVITDDLDIPNKKYIDDKIPNLDNYYTKKEIDELKSDIDTIISFKQEQTDNKLETTNKTVVGGINEINKKLEDFKIIKWKVIGNRINDKKWHIPTAPFNQYIYRVFVTWEVTEENPLNKGYQQVIFFKSPKLIGTGNWRIASGKIGNSDSTLNINFDNTDWSLTLNGGNGGAIISLEVLEPV
ncbi:hypothetical protein [Spiroplasma endosymbiont of Cleonymus obscurus]|uniref:hypothetical protein n=1 Tax=Spiroplasma endosymbiont of Cleonymus obscurus TaxID=3066324 RepID=UPI0037DDC28F